jgi:ribosomal protein S18 acetylase RimI-like enzyme
MGIVADISLVLARFDRERHLPLLLEADESEQHMRVYLDRGQLLEIYNAGGMIGLTVIVRDADEVEIWNIALSEGYRGRGLGRAAVGAIADRCRRDGASRLAVGTSDCSLGTIAFYRKVGFRFAGVRQGYFDTYPVAVVENGIRARDMVMFQMPLAPSSTSNRDDTTEMTCHRDRSSDASLALLSRSVPSMFDRAACVERDVGRRTSASLGPNGHVPLDGRAGTGAGADGERAAQRGQTIRHVLEAGAERCRGAVEPPAVVADRELELPVVLVQAHRDLVRLRVFRGVLQGLERAEVDGRLELLRIATDPVGLDVHRYG